MAIKNDVMAANYGDSQPVKRGRGRPPLSPEEKKRRAEERALNPGPLPPNHPHALKNMEPGDNTKYLNHALAVRNMPPIDRTDPAQVDMRIKEYFELCAQHDMKPTVTGFCNALQVPRQTIFEWKHGNVRAGTHQDIILKAYAMLEELWENYMLNGKINPVSGIFLGKNFWHYADKQEYVLTPNQGAIDSVDVATIEAKYAELPDSED